MFRNYGRDCSGLYHKSWDLRSCWAIVVSANECGDDRIHDRLCTNGEHGELEIDRGGAVSTDEWNLVRVDLDDHDFGQGELRV